MGSDDNTFADCLKEYINRNDIETVFSLQRVDDQQAIEALNKIVTHYFDTHLTEERERISDDKNVIELSFHHPSNRSPIVYYAMVRLLYYSIRLNKDAGFVESADLIDTTIKWLRACIQINGETNLFFEHYDGLDREKEVKRILLNVDSGNGSWVESGPMLDYISDVKVRHYLLNHLLNNWFLPRYDLGTASKVIRAMTRRGNRSENAYHGTPLSGRVPKRKLSFLNRVALFTIVILTLMAISFAPLFGNKDPISMVSWLGLSFPRGLSASFFVLFLYVTVGIIFFGFKSVRGVLMPRLIGGISVGYLFLMSSDSVVNFILHAEFASTITVAIFSVVLSYILLYLEVSRRLALPIKKLNQRTSGLFLISLIESIVIGFFVSHVFSGVFSEHLSGATPSLCPFPGPFMGIIYPNVVITFIPLALLVGIVLQLFWEEKPISQL